MSQQPQRPAYLTLAAFAALLIGTVSLAFTGWLAHSTHTGLRAVEDAAYLAFRALIFDGVYASPDQIEAGAGGDWRLIAARWMGGAVFAWAAAAAVLAIFQSAAAAFRARMARGRLLVIGDHDIAAAFVSEALGREPVIHLTGEVDEPRREGRLIRLPHRAGDADDAMVLAGRARRVVVAEADPADSAEVALSLARTHARKAGVSVHISTPWVAERLHHLADGDEVFAFSEANAGARAVMAAHPPFLLARRKEASAPHILIVGFDDFGEALACDLVAAGRTADQGPPWISVLEPDAGRLADFAARRPEFDMAATLTALSGRAGDAVAWPKGAPAVCAVYVCARSVTEGLAAAVALQERARRDTAFSAPIFIHTAGGGGLAVTHGGTTHLADLQIYGFGRLDEAAHISGAALPDPDIHARAVHEAYLAISARLARDAAPRSVSPWDSLSEIYRVSNRRVIAHISAKLASLDFDLEPWLALPAAERPVMPALHPDDAVWRSEGERAMIAELEHERSLADRRLEGWRLGPRDDHLKLHPNLVAFAALPEDVRAFDFGVADWLLETLPRSPGGLRRRPCTWPQEPL